MAQKSAIAQREQEQEYMVREDRDKSGEGQNSAARGIHEPGLEDEAAVEISRRKADIPAEEARMQQRERLYHESDTKSRSFTSDGTIYLNT